MSDQQGPNEPIDDDSLAFEYASGLMRDEERLQFERRLNDEPVLQAFVHEWEEHLEHLQDRKPLEPKLETWSNIEQRLNTATIVTPSARHNWIWALFGAAATAFVFLVIPTQNLDQGLEKETDQTTAQTIETVDYVAVMTDENQQPGLTTFGYAKDKRLRLHWQLNLASNDEEDFQLWAKSKRDGQIRSIAILENASSQELQLSDAHWRLVTDAETLILTIEEAGGSAIDEPSDMMVATGVCVRIAAGGLSG